MWLCPKSVQSNGSNIMLYFYGQLNEVLSECVNPLTVGSPVSFVQVFSVSHRLTDVGSDSV